MFGKDKNEEFHEKILYETQPNIFVYSKGILISMFVLGFLFFLYSAGIRYIGNMNVYLIESTKTPLTTYFALAVFVMILIVVLYIILKLLIWTSIKYTITENRVIVEKGILLNKKNSMPFNTIQDVGRSQSLLGKIFSVGSITLYSAYDGKDLELKDISSPKKVENIIFENMRGTHLRRPNLYNDNYVDGYEFNPIRPNSDDHTHYRRMEDLDDLELVDAKQRKKELREIRCKARNSRNNYNNSNYDSGYGSNPNYGSAYGSNPNYGSAYDDYYESGDDYRGNGYADNRYADNRYADNGPRDNYGYRNSHYGGSRDYPDSHHHQYSGAIKESYERNPDKYFANNYEEFHQSNLDAQNDYIEDRNSNQGSSAPRANYEDSFEDEKKSKGLSRFNPFSSGNKEDSYEDNISDEEFDSTINQAMHDMDSNIRFEPSNNQFNKSNNDYNRGYHNANRPYGQSYNHNDAYRPHPDMERSRPVRDDYDSYDSRGHYGKESYGSRNDYGREGYGSRNGYGNQSYESRDSRYDSRKQYNDRYDGNYYGHSPSYGNDDRYDSRNAYNHPNNYNSNYDKSRNQSRKHSRNAGNSRRNENRYNQNHYENKDYGEEYRSESDDGKKEKTSDDLFAKHSRKFRR